MFLYKLYDIFVHKLHTIFLSLSTIMLVQIYTLGKTKSHLNLGKFLLANFFENSNSINLNFY